MCAYDSSASPIVRREPERRTDGRSPSLARSEAIRVPVRGASLWPSIDVPEKRRRGQDRSKLQEGSATVTLPKKREAQKPAKKIEVKAA